jgi:hypothetical protein
MATETPGENVPVAVLGTGAAPASFADFARRTAAAWAVDQAQ